MRVAVIGQVVIDSIYRSDPSASRDRDVPPLAERVGGKGFNIAAALAQVGAEVELVTAVGNDRNGELAVSKAKDLGVGTRFIRSSSYGRSTPLTRTPIRRGFFGTRKAEVVTPTPRVSLDEGRDRERDVVLDQDERMGAFYSGAIGAFEPSAFDCVVCTWELDHGLLEDVANRSVAAGVPIVCNPAPLPSRGHSGVPVNLIGVLNKTSILVPNRFEAAYLADRLHPSPKCSPKDASEIANRHGIDWVVVTYGSMGWAWANRDGESNANQGRVRDVVNKVGASDVFTGVLTAMRFAGAEIEVAAKAAGEAAGLAVASPGGAERFPTADQIADSFRDGPLSRAAMKILEQMG